MGVGTCDGHTKVDEFPKWLADLEKYIVYGQGCMFLRDLGILNTYPEIEGGLQQGFLRGGTHEEACKYLDNILRQLRRRLFNDLCEGNYD